MTKKEDATFEKRKALLNTTFQITKETHDRRREELFKQSHKVELILIAWGFLFAGVAGFYQAAILSIHNVLQIFGLLIPMLISVFISVWQVMTRRMSIDVPKLSELWKQYTTSYQKSFEEYDEITLKEQLVQEYIKAEESNRNALSRKAMWLGIASILVAVEIFIIILFVWMDAQPIQTPC